MGNLPNSKKKNLTRMSKLGCHLSVLLVEINNSELHYIYDFLILYPHLYLGKC
jgi:hypothetical protein